LLYEWASGHDVVGPAAPAFRWEQPPATTAYL